MSSSFLSHTVCTDTGNLSIQVKHHPRSQSHGLDPYDSQLQLQTITMKRERLFIPPLKMYRCSTTSTSALETWNMFTADIWKIYLLSPYTLPLRMCEIRGLFIGPIGKKHIPNVRTTPLLVLSYSSNRML